MQTEENKRLLTISLCSYTFAGFMYYIAISTKSIPLLVLFYIISLALMLSSTLALFKGYQKEKNKKIFLFLTLIGVMLMALITIATINNLIV
ncbi:MAG: hypothetical protein PHH04_04205 [Thomasclavelia sp.]|nr:hypothetical protein [Thomasclavelia sp.]